LITGAASGLGRALAVRLGRDGARVAVADARVLELKETAARITAAGGEALLLPGGCADPASVKRQYAAIRARWGGLDLAVLGDEAAARNDARTFSADAYHRAFATNVLGAVNWLEAVLPDMRASGGGTVVGLSSMAAWRGLPRLGPYSASKAALSTLLESARLDLVDSGVRVVILHPKLALDAESAADDVIRGIAGGRRQINTPRGAALLMSVFVRHLPDFLYDRLASWAVPALLGAPPEAGEIPNCP
jgi:NAD(P)-dependent dehydrogenase (short-subunit alcohol dehydrogenase family)